jgi:hypothetical protein
MGLSISTTRSTQEAVQTIAQTYSGLCEFSVNQNMNDISVILKDTTFKGNITFSQMAYADGQCQINSSMDATASILFTAANSSSASTAVGLLPWPSVDIASATSFQSMRQNLNQAANESCSISATNNMSDILVFMQNSDFTGNLTFSQEGSSTGSCALNNSMSANVNSTGQSQNNAQSGKSKLGGLGGAIGGLVGIIIVVVILIAIIKAFAGKKNIKKPPVVNPTLYPTTTYYPPVDQYYPTVGYQQ